MKRLFYLLILCVAFISSSCDRWRVPFTTVQHPDWSQSAVIYEVNLRQYTQEGTLQAFDQHIDRLADLGIDILWFMPIHPIGLEERKGELGSYYSVRDYRDVNPEFGTLDDFRKTVELAHARGMKVVLDWVANHTSRDHAWITEHPDWFVKDSTGAILAPFDWSDVAQLDLQNPQMRAAMVEEMKFWVVEYGVDGFRCDVAWNVPADFWEYAFSELKKIRSDLYFLAEAEKEDLVVNAFDSYYGWEFHHLINKLAKGEANALDLVKHINDHVKRFPVNSIQLNFITNHDENSWAGTEFERMGDAARQMAVLTFCYPGMPMLYSGQEVGLSKRLEFFKRDPITYEDPMNMSAFYKDLIALRDAHPSMYAPTTGGLMVLLETSAPNEIFAFERRIANDGFVALFNFSDKEVSFNYRDGSMTLAPHGYKLVF